MKLIIQKFIGVIIFILPFFLVGNVSAWTGSPKMDSAPTLAEALKLFPDANPAAGDGRAVTLPKALRSKIPESSARSIEGNGYLRGWPTPRGEVSIEVRFTKRYQKESLPQLMRTKCRAVTPEFTQCISEDFEISSSGYADLKMQEIYLAAMGGLVKLISWSSDGQANLELQPEIWEKFVASGSIASTGDFIRYIPYGYSSRDGSGNRIYRDENENWHETPRMRGCRVMSVPTQFSSYAGYTPGKANAIVCTADKLASSSQAYKWPSGGQVQRLQDWKPSTYHKLAGGEGDDVPVGQSFLWIKENNMALRIPNLTDKIIDVKFASQ